MNQKGYDRTADFMLAEYQSSRARISADIDEINKSEIFYLTVWALIYAAIFQFKIIDPGFLKGIILLPLITSIYSLLRYNAHRVVIKSYEKYIKDNVETYFLEFGSSPSGLCSFYDAFPGKILKPVRFVFHVAIILFSFAFAALVWCHSEYAISIIVNGGK